MNVRKRIDFSSSTLATDQRKSLGQVWFFDELNLGPTVQTGHGCIGLLGLGHTKWHRAPIAESRGLRGYARRFLLNHFNPSPILPIRIKTKAGTFTNRLPQHGGFPATGMWAEKSAKHSGLRQPFVCRRAL